MNNLYLALFGFFGYAIVLIGLEVIGRKLRLSPEYLRRISHVSGALLAAVIGSLTSGPIFLGTIGLFVPLMLLSRSRHLFKHIHGVSRPTIGEELLPVGIISAYLIAGGRTEIFVPAVLVVGLADPLTGIVMQELKNHFLGFLMFVIVATIIIFFFSVPLLLALLIAAAAAGVERLSPFGSDNFTIPLVVAAALRLL